MEFILSTAARTIIFLLQLLPVKGAALIGAALGQLVYFIDARHRKVALKNLALCFGKEKSSAELRQIARKNFRRIGENFAAAISLAHRDSSEVAKHLTVRGIEKVSDAVRKKQPGSRIFATGHFGNFELCSRLGYYVPGITGATTYRGLKQPALNRIMQQLREKSGCRYFERRHEGAALKAALQNENIFLGLLADQHAGNRGLPLDFFGHLSSTSAAPAVFALRYHRPLHTILCFRKARAQWEFEIGDEIPTHKNGEIRSSSQIMQEVNQRFEEAIRRDPSNWFWVHNRWKPFDRAERGKKEITDAAETDHLQEA